MKRLTATDWEQEIIRFGYEVGKMGGLDKINTMDPDVKKELERLKKQGEKFYPFGAPEIIKLVRAASALGRSHKEAMDNVNLRLEQVRQLNSERAKVRNK